MTGWLAYALQSLAWSAFGLLLGYATCSTALAVRIRTMAGLHRAEQPPSTEPIHPVRWRVLGIVLIVLGFITVYNSLEARQQQACQAAFNDDFAQVSTLRAKWNDEDRRALVRMLAIWGSPGTTRTQAYTALQVYLDTVDRNEKRRAATPLPNLAARNC